MATGESKQHFPSICLNLVVREDDGFYSSGNRRLIYPHTEQ